MKDYMAQLYGYFSAVDVFVLTLQWLRKNWLTGSHKTGGFCYIFIRILIQRSLEDFLCSSRRNIYIINAGKSVNLLLSGEWLHTHIIMIAYWPCSGHTSSLMAMVRYVIRYFSASLLNPVSIKSRCINCCHSYILKLIRVGNLKSRYGG